MNEARLARFEAAMQSLPLVAILRGLPPEDAEAAAQTLLEAGFRLIEVPLNSPDPFTSIATMRQVLPPEVLVGASTVMSAAQVRQLADIGADLMVTPHTDPVLIAAAKAAGLVSLPGFFTPSEAFAALAAGATALKLFPAEQAGPATVKALRAVLPASARVLPVGGVSPETLATWRAAGVAGFGLGSALYGKGTTVAELGERARRFVAAWRAS
ncbi:MAG: 2-dehydro-3-deoxy-6-phosphogalactonate aldolase [Candidatus Dactylopiibacterium carminicum]|uniref:2-dehydro-3-deoxy-6-phosphogalactonate aldolase n=1 Tax=Candidatus Dactylopiibacterium carminicum TaxID=857335 RepID=A0A272EMT1_9RHOO|nr:2-dehydro-3-deoxy-6-phosphogalactonate aldolase [Candidatus Dactylopiibacterium carminicum]KAF7597820.1 2-dehydro-3-deoxy-6-phosphogalactonate aldolase [Candidatus Dactylopiibacterium carminicum]PAS91414.1 MAG: 2-dehydro-3-deoxy-6-phosphogalactonate aldolase [Candidatus Dactylopiibacterium carminicum]